MTTSGRPLMKSTTSGRFALAFAALAELAGAARRANSIEDKRRAKAALLAGGGLLGLLQQDPETWFRGANATINPAAVEDLLDQRRAARAARDFQRADAIRDQLASMGIAIEDGPQGTRWKMAGNNVE